VKLEHSFEVAAPVDVVWPLLLDIERVAPCLPGAEVTERVDERAYRARMRVRLGPMRMSYAGDLAIDAVDEGSRTAVLRAAASETRGQGSANAAIELNVGEGSPGSRVSITTDLELSGRAAQTGRGLVERVADQMLGQFAGCLRERLAAGEHEPVAAATTSAPAQPARIGIVRALLQSLLGWLRGERRRGSR
jgi:carbon monoxide dehydrogenase subunit G